MTGSTLSLGKGVRLRLWLGEFVLGPRFARRLALSHAIDDFGDAMINLALVGSLFLSISLDASRSRVTLYLILTAVPLVLVAPVIGSVLDRTRFGYRLAISGSQMLRAVVSLAMIGSLLTLALFPLTFLVLVSRKAYALAKAALLSHIAGDSEALLRSDAHIARTGTIVGGIGTVLGGLLLATDHVEVMLVIAASAFAAAALVSQGLANPAPTVRLRSIPSLRDAIPTRIRTATIAVAAVRAAGGALTYLLAFAIKRGGGDDWIFAAGLLVAGLGGLLANLLATKIHRTLEPETVLVLVLLVPGVVCALGVVTIGNLGVLAIAFSIGLGSAVGTRTITILNASVPRLARARSIARSEFVFQLASLIGAILAVQFAPTPNAGFAVSSLVLVSVGFAFSFHQRRALREHASRLLLGDQAPAIDRRLPDALIAEAQRLATLGAYRMAIVVAAAAVDILVEREPLLVDSAEFTDWAALETELTDVRSSDAQPGEEVMAAVLGCGDALLRAASTDVPPRFEVRQPLL